MEIYNYLKERGKSTVSVLTKFVHLTQPTVSYHLKEMKDSGLLKSEKHGKEVLYDLNSACPIYKNECVLHSINFSKETYAKSK